MWTIMTVVVAVGEAAPGATRAIALTGTTGGVAVVSAAEPWDTITDDGNR